MLLGILFHAALSFVEDHPYWPVLDDRQGQFGNFLQNFVHGFRMPLFFLLSGFFTVMLWRRLGSISLLKHRYRRIVLPLALGFITIIPFNSFSW